MVESDISLIPAAVSFARQSVTVSAERVDGSTPGARVTWSTTVPPECVASVTVDFRTSSSGSVVRSYTTTNTSETEVIQTGLQCGTTYYIRVVVTGIASRGALSRNPVPVRVGGKVTACVAVHTWNAYSYYNITHLLFAISQIYHTQS